MEQGYLAPNFLKFLNQNSQKKMKKLMIQKMMKKITYSNNGFSTKFTKAKDLLLKVI